MIELGQGSPIVLIPGIQGRCEWMRPTIQALAERHRVMTFSLGSVTTFDDWIRAIDAALDRAGERSATLVGISFGGLIAVHYAAARSDRVRALVLVSTPSPGYQMDRWSAACVRHPFLLAPFFFARACVRLGPEIMTARPTWLGRLRLSLEYGARVLAAPASPHRMARYVHAWRAANLTGDAARVAAPTLVVTGEPHLDRVVPVSSSRQYLDLIAGARHLVLERTGHVGIITAPRRFADAIDEFIDESINDQPTHPVARTARARHVS